MQADPTIEIVYTDGDKIVEAPEFEDRSVEIAKISKFILTELPTWFLCLLGFLIGFVLILAVLLFKRRYSVKLDEYCDDTKVKLFH